MNAYRKYILPIYLSIFILFQNQLSFAQESITIKGRVFDKVSKDPIGGALVAVKGYSKRTVTNQDGSFSLHIAASLPLQLQVSFLGYVPEEFVVKNQNTPIIAALSVQHILGNEIVVSASRIPERILESPVSIERISIEDIKKTAATSFYDGLVNLKGVEQSTQSFTFKSLNTRGFNANGNVRFNQFLDGMDNQAPGLNFSVGNIAGITDLDLESAELIPGSSSALYGAGGINGTLLLNSKSPFIHQGLSVQLKTGINHIDKSQQGVANWNDVQVRYAKALNSKLAFKVNFSYLQADDWKALDQSNYDRTGMLGKVGDRSSDPAYDGINVYGDEIKVNMRNVAQAVVGTARQAYIKEYESATGSTPYDAQIQGFLSVMPSVSPFYLGLQNGIIPNQDVSRTGYLENDLVDYNTSSFRTSGSFNYKIRKDIEASAQAYWGTGTSVYTGADRYSLKNFNIGQYKLELKGNRFFLRAYTTQERSGDAYNTTALASLINERSKPSTAWFPQYVGAYLAGRKMGQDETQAHLTARSTADNGRFVPGSEEFIQAKQDIASRTIGAQGGAKFNDKTNLWHYEGMYNLSGLISAVDLIAGASYRLYDLNSGGTLFDDLNKKLTIAEYGAYVQGTKKFFDEKLKFVTSIRYDKSENFSGFLSPRVAAVWNLSKNHYFRFSYQSGFRNPTAQSQYIDLLVRAGSRLVGALPQLLDKYELKTNKPYTDLSYRAYVESGYSNPSVLENFTFSVFKPEKVQVYEIGYRALLTSALHLDASYYYNNYRDFLTAAILWQNPTPGNPTGLMSPVRYETTVNVQEPVKAQGWALGMEYNWKKLKWMANVAQDKLSKMPDKFFNTYNTPAYKFNAGVGGNEIIRNTDFNLTYRWQDQFIWRSAFASGEVPAYGTLDAQLSFKLPAYRSILKIGGANLLNKYYVTSVGNPSIGGMYYISLVFEGKN
ncbi:TonB-dependent receptor [Pseudopedobacter saltans DSM 12145]|uniref:TonB-dependent receptor n=1 Tax=Pseudopedobacter saltans (strain ATCC 51119 / DSM 12145 / JCM 21818 / CCUG 39354 / LMG 10337 / NBRC 100064 / NCIMB 13643) TaxID=762903 RepID=F0SAF9_PSESL|nr:TonB-dependent receptor [Pseudopedobacter saltans]ADY52579.1 TonB-dependent receptor [Pseudopedobacter saltans DSM 12145]